MAKIPVDKTIFRRRRSRYTSISNTPLRDKGLSFEAVGFLACIMSLPEDWRFNRAWARKRFDVGREKLDRIIKELTAAGYVEYRQERDDRGQMGGSVYTFTDEPGDFGDDEPPTEKPLPGNPAAGEPAPTKDLPSTNHEFEEKRPTARDAEAPRPGAAEKQAPPSGVVRQRVTAPAAPSGRPASEPPLRGSAVLALVASAVKPIPPGPRRYRASQDDMKSYRMLELGLLE